MKNVLCFLTAMIVIACNQTKNQKIIIQDGNNSYYQEEEIILSLSSQSPDTLISGGKMYVLKPINEAYFKSISNNLEEVMPNKSIIINSDSLIIKCTEKEVVLKNNTTDGESMVIYEYLTTLHEIGYVHIRALCWECTEDIFINIKNGKEFTFWHNPIVSPNNTLIVSYCWDLEAQFMPNGLQLFKIVGDSIVKIFDWNISTWGPEEVKWESDTSIVIKRATPSDNIKYKYDFVRMSF